MSRARELCVESAILKGGIGANQIHTCDEWDIRPMMEEHPQIFANRKGYGLWSWKPYLIDRLTGVAGFVRNVRNGDVVCYADAGIEFIAPVSHIIDRMDQDIFLFGNNWPHYAWCKRDVVQEIWPSKFWEPNLEYHSDMAVTWERFGKQCQASVIFFRVSDYSRKFVAEWLKWCLFEGGRLIDDSPSRSPNHPEFRENRHDQSILTTLAYREGLKLHYWPAVYNRGSSPEFVYEKLPEYAGDTYPILFSHHRKRNHEWSNAA
jgi:hypothetical protein